MNKFIKVLSLAMALFFGQIIFAQNAPDPSIDSIDELIEQVENGLEQMMDQLKSEEFQDALQEAKSKSNDLKITKDSQGAYMFNGEPVNLDGLFEPAQDIADLLNKDINISGDLDELLEKSGSMIETLMEDLEKLMEENFKDLDDINIDIPDNQSKTKTL